MRRLLTAAVALVVLALALGATTASAATWSEPDVTSLSGSLAKGEGNWLELPWTVVWELGPIVSKYLK